jgi:hypothetical protein
MEEIDGAQAQGDSEDAQDEETVDAADPSDKPEEEVVVVVVGRRRRNRDLSEELTDIDLPQGKHHASHLPALQYEREPHVQVA